MANKEEKKAVLEHMENRTQWHKDDQERVEKLRDEVDAKEKGRGLTASEKKDNKVQHKH